jgi:7-cyano-7-deazaguanine synthase
MTQRQLAVVLVSGGMDSAVAAAITAEKYTLAMMHVQYGQRTEERELRAFHAVADHFDAEQRLVVRMDHLGFIGGSSLTDTRMAIPEADLHRQGIPTSYVPFRNANLLSAAISWAEVLGASAVVMGAVEEDSSGYPDCRRSFFDAFAAAVREGTKPETSIALLTPVIGMSKADIVRQGLARDVPFQLTWSCYTGDDQACGKCDSCALRLRAFFQAGVEDPLPYTIRNVSI